QLSCCKDVIKSAPDTTAFPLPVPAILDNAISMQGAKDIREVKRREPREHIALRSIPAVSCIDTSESIPLARPEAYPLVRGDHLSSCRNTAICRLGLRCVQITAEDAGMGRRRGQAGIDTF